jgi:hypothetical protein
VSEQRWDDLRKRLHHNAAEEAASPFIMSTDYAYYGTEEVAALLAERDQLAEALAFIVPLSYVRERSDGSAVVGDTGCGCCMDDHDVPPHLVDLLLRVERDTGGEAA